MTTNNEHIDGIPVEAFKVRVSGTLELEEDIARMLHLDGRVVFIAVGRTGEATYKADEERGVAVRKDIITVETLLPLNGPAREQAISYMRDPAQNLIMVPYVDTGTGEVRLPKEEEEPEPGPIEQAIDEDPFEADGPPEGVDSEPEPSIADQVIPRVDISGYTPEAAAEAIQAAERGEIELVVAEKVFFELQEGTDRVLEALDQMEADDQTEPRGPQEEEEDAWPDPRSFEQGSDGEGPRRAPSNGSKGDGPGYAPVPYEDLLNVGPAAPAGASTGGGQQVGHVGDYR